MNQEAVKAPISRDLIPSALITLFDKQNHFAIGFRRFAMAPQTHL